MSPFKNQPTEMPHRLSFFLCVVQKRKAHKQKQKTKAATIKPDEYTHTNPQTVCFSFFFFFFPLSLSRLSFASLQLSLSLFLPVLLLQSRDCANNLNTHLVASSVCCLFVDPCELAQPPFHPTLRVALVSRAAALVSP